MQDRPTVLELLDAVRTFLESDLVPVLEGRRQFHARVAANVLAIAKRELHAGAAQLRDEWQRLTTVLGYGTTAGDPPADPGELRAAVARFTDELAARVRAGEADSGPWRAVVLVHLRATALEKLAIANPTYLGLLQGCSVRS